jgi:hypothetical protein
MKIAKSVVVSRFSTGSGFEPGAFVIGRRGASLDELEAL